MRQEISAVLKVDDRLDACKILHRVSVADVAGIIALLVPVRAMLGHFFDKDHLAFLDADEEPEEEGSHWV